MEREYPKKHFVNENTSAYRMLLKNTTNNAQVNTQQHNATLQPDILSKLTQFGNKVWLKVSSFLVKYYIHIILLIMFISSIIYQHKSYAISNQSQNRSQVCVHEKDNGENITRCFSNYEYQEYICDKIDYKSDKCEAFKLQSRKDMNILNITVFSLIAIMVALVVAFGCYQRIAYKKIPY